MFSVDFKLLTEISFLLTIREMYILTMKILKGDAVLDIVKGALPSGGGDFVLVGFCPGEFYPRDFDMSPSLLRPWSLHTALASSDCMEVHGLVTLVLPCTRLVNIATCNCFEKAHPYLPVS